MENLKRSILWTDFETGGLTVGVHSPLQFACIAEVNGKVVGEWCVDIRQPPLVATEEALRITGIDISKPGLSFAEFRVQYWERINSWFYSNRRPNKDNMPFFAGQNTSFDRPWLQHILGSTWDGIYFHKIDTLILANMLVDMGLLKKDPDLKLGSLCKVLGVKVEAAMHDALVDVRATRECYKKMKEIIFKQHQAFYYLEDL